jgi:hypothetical protein
MSKFRRGQLQVILIVLFFGPIVSYFKDVANFSFQETLGISPWIVFAVTLLICLALAVYGHRKTKKADSKI